MAVKSIRKRSNLLKDFIRDVATEFVETKKRLTINCPFVSPDVNEMLNYTIRSLTEIFPLPLSKESKVKFVEFALLNMIVRHINLNMSSRLKRYPFFRIQITPVLFTGIFQGEISTLKSMADEYEVRRIIREILRTDKTKKKAGDLFISMLDRKLFKEKQVGEDVLHLFQLMHNDRWLDLYERGITIEFEDYKRVLTFYDHLEKFIRKVYVDFSGSSGKIEISEGFYLAYCSYDKYLSEDCGNNYEDFVIENFTFYLTDKGHYVGSYLINPDYKAFYFKIFLASISLWHEVITREFLYVIPDSSVYPIEGVLEPYTKSFIINSRKQLTAIFKKLSKYRSRRALCL